LLREKEVVAIMAQPGWEFSLGDWMRKGHLCSGAAAGAWQRGVVWLCEP